MGFMGSGKSTIGRRTAKLLNYPFIDSDNLIEERYGSISTIFETQGEKQFRIIESDIIKEVLIRKKSVVFSIGGGGFCSSRNVKICLDNAVIFYLNCTFNICYDRIRRNANRPLAKKGKKWLMKLYNRRLPYYNNATLMVDSDKSANETAKEIILLYNRTKKS